MTSADSESLPGWTMAFATLPGTGSSAGTSLQRSAACAHHVSPSQAARSDGPFLRGQHVALGTRGGNQGDPGSSIGHHPADERATCYARLRVCQRSFQRGKYFLLSGEVAALPYKTQKYAFPGCGALVHRCFFLGVALYPLPVRSSQPTGNTKRKPKFPPCEKGRSRWGCSQGRKVDHLMELRIAAPLRPGATRESSERSRSSTGSLLHQPKPLESGLAIHDLSASDEDVLQLAQLQRDG